MRKLIRGGTVVTAADESQADVLIDGEEIIPKFTKVAA